MGGRRSRVERLSGRGTIVMGSGPKGGWFVTFNGMSRMGGRVANRHGRVAAVSVSGRFNGGNLPGMGFSGSSCGGSLLRCGRSYVAAVLSVSPS